MPEEGERCDVTVECGSTSGAKALVKSGALNAGLKACSTRLGLLTGGRVFSFFPYFPDSACSFFS